VKPGNSVIGSSRTCLARRGEDMTVSSPVPAYERTAPVDKIDVRGWFSPRCYRSREQTTSSRCNLGGE
jgi:hypothetical protein